MYILIYFCFIYFPLYNCTCLPTSTLPLRGGGWAKGKPNINAILSYSTIFSTGSPSCYPKINYTLFTEFSNIFKITCQHQDAVAYTPVTTGWDGARLLCGNHIAPSHWALSSTDILKQYCVVLLILSFVHQPGAVHHRSDAPQLGHYHIIHICKHRGLFIQHKSETEFGMKINNVNEQ